VQVVDRAWTIQADGYADVGISKDAEGFCGQQHTIRLQRNVAASAARHRFPQLRSKVGQPSSSEQQRLASMEDNTYMLQVPPADILADPLHCRS